jgi:hypothetical protein
MPARFLAILWQKLELLQLQAELHCVASSPPPTTIAAYELEVVSSDPRLPQNFLIADVILRLAFFCWYSMPNRRILTVPTFHCMLGTRYVTQQTIGSVGTTILVDVFASGR